TEVATVFCNELFDFDTDRQNEFYSPFNGGSRVLVEKEIIPATLSKAIMGLLGGVFVSGLLILLVAPGDPWPQLAMMVALVVAGLGYTLPPLKLSWRGLGELTVGLTHSLAVI